MKFLSAATRRACARVQPPLTARLSHGEAKEPTFFEAAPVLVGTMQVFLFVMMMLNVKISESSSSVYRYLPIGLFLSVLFLFEIYLIVEGDLNSIDVFEFNKSEYSILQDESLINIPRVDFVESPTDVIPSTNVESPIDVVSPRDVTVETRIILFLGLVIFVSEFLA